MDMTLCFYIFRLCIWIWAHKVSHFDLQNNAVLPELLVSFISLCSQWFGFQVDEVNIGDTCDCIDFRVDSLMFLLNLWLFRNTIFFLFWVGGVKVLKDIIWLREKVDCVGFLIFWFWLDTDWVYGGHEVWRLCKCGQE